MSIKRVGVLAGALCVVSLSYALPPAPAKLSGGILGLVVSSSGVPQMGAAVLLYNRYDHLLQRVITTEQGAFHFAALVPDVYTIRVSLASFLPALQRNIVVQPGMQSLLNVNLATVFSSIQLVAVVPADSSLMSEEWKWVLRSSSATRPVLRLLPDLAPAGSSPPPSASGSWFSSTSGMVKVSGGDQGSVLSADPDLGTAFALATCFLGANHLRLSGNFGYASSSGTAATAFHTSFRREFAGGESPELNLTVRQLSVPLRARATGLGDMSDSSAPVLRSLSTTLRDQTRLTDKLRFEYGASLDSVTFLDSLNYFSPYGRMTYERGKGEVFQFSYASGAPPAQLLARALESGGQLQEDLAALAAFPQVSLSGNRVQVQRSQNWEAGYRRAFGSRSFGVSAYAESITNAAVALSGAENLASLQDLLPDPFSDSWVFNAGQYRSLGFIASVDQKLGDHLDLASAYGSDGTLTADQNAPAVATPDELRAALRKARRHSVTTRVSGLAPWTGTRFAASYQWADLAALMPAHTYLTQPMQEPVGLNLQVRQPIPYFGGLSGHLEATADLCNLLAQGYLPLSTTSGRVLLVPYPRTLRGGLSFIF
ncbi:MAG: carboxypeptidase regulatory-like domain-containing protein [Bryobacteraceae bacterium]